MKRLIKHTKSPRDDRATLIRPGAYTKICPLSPIQVENDRMVCHCPPFASFAYLALFMSKKSGYFVANGPSGSVLPPEQC